jgi:hypothetical protein
MSGGLAALAADAYVYGYALVANVRRVGRFIREGTGPVPAAPFNRFTHATGLAGPGKKFASVNNDTVYSLAQVDLSNGPVRLGVPDTAGRYYVLQFVDAWTNNFAYVGRRATGTAARSFLLVPPGWRGAAPDGARAIEFPTVVGTIVGRWACDGPADLPAVHALQGALVLEPDAGMGLTKGIPSPSAVPDELAFFERLRAWMQAFPPSGADRAYQERFRPLALLDPASPYGDCPDRLAGALAEGAVTARQRIETAMEDGGQAPSVNGWLPMYHSFDYNLDYLGLGTLGGPEWRMTDRTASYLARALAARAGLWGNHGYEAAYAVTFADADGDRLDGRRRYTLRFPEPPPVDAFWSITMYDLPDFYLVGNPIGRYSIGDRTPGLRADRDGAVTIAIQHDRPADTANWLPAPAAPFRPVLRMYQPREPVLDGTYRVPSITKARRSAGSPQLGTERIRVSPVLLPRSPRDHPARRYLSTATGAKTATSATDQMRATARSCVPPVRAERTASTIGVMGWYLANGWSQPGIEPGGTYVLDRNARMNAIIDMPWAACALAENRPMTMNTTVNTSP